MSCAHDEEPPVLVLDEFNDLGEGKENINAMDAFMQQCLNDELVCLNGWGKMKPLQAVHNSSVFVEHGKREKPSWKALAWFLGQLQKVVLKHVKGCLGMCNFLHAGMDPLAAIEAANLHNDMHYENCKFDDASDEDTWAPTPPSCPDPA